MGRFTVCSVSASAESLPERPDLVSYSSKTGLPELVAFCCIGANGLEFLKWQLHLQETIR